MANIGGHARDVLFVLGVVCAMAVGGVVGVYCTWGLILVLSVVLGIVFFISGSSLDSRTSGHLHVFVPVSILLFLITSWCSFWISLAGVLRK